MKKLPLLALVATISMVLAGCTTGGGGGTTSSDSSSTQTSSGTSDSSSTLGITGVEISGYDSTDVIGGTRVTLTAAVQSSSGASNLRVTWSSSDEDVATVRNGAVQFKSVSEDKTVTITATSQDDTTKSGNVVFNVKYCPIDLETSRGNPDASLYVDEGKITIETPGDTALIYGGVHGTKWYVEADVLIEDFAATENWAKVGFMVGTNSSGYWNNSTESVTVKNYFYYIDASRNSMTSGWTSFNLVGQNEEHTDWNWGNQPGYFTVSTDDRVTMTEPYKMGLLRDGANYYLYTQAQEGTETVMKCRKMVSGFNDIAADEDTYVWFGGWGTAYTASNFRSITDSAAVDAFFESPTNFRVSVSEQVLGFNETYQLSVASDTIIWKHDNIEWSTSDSTVATVDQTGLVTANPSKDGTATITAKYSDTISASCTVTVTNVNTIWDKENAVGPFSYAHEIDSDPYVEVAADPTLGAKIWSLPFKDVNTTKFYATMTVEMTQGQSPTEPYSKIGIAAYKLGGDSTNNFGGVQKIYWYAQDSTVDGGSNPMVMGNWSYNAEAPEPAEGQTSPWAQGGWCWDVGGGERYFDAPENIYKPYGWTYTFNLLRDGVHYYFFRDGNLIAHYDDPLGTFAADEASRVGLISFGGIGAKISNASVLTGTDVDSIIASLANNVQVEGTNWIKSGQVAVTDGGSSLKFGSNTNGGGVKEGTNIVEYNEKLNAGFTIEYDIKNFSTSTASWYYPKAEVVITKGTEEFRLCYAFRPGTLNSEFYFARFETCCYGNWQNGQSFGDEGQFDPLATHHVEIEVTDEGTLSMYLDNQQMVLEGSEGLTRGIGSMIDSDSTLRIRACFASFEMSNVTLTVNSVN